MIHDKGNVEVGLQYLKIVTPECHFGRPDGDHAKAPMFVVFVRDEEPVLEGVIQRQLRKGCQGGTG